VFLGLCMNPLAELIDTPERITEIPAAAVPVLLAKLASVQSLLTSRLLLDSTTRSVEPAVTDNERLLTAKEAAPILGVTPHWLYRHAKKLPFTRRLSRKVLRFSESGIRRYMSIKKS
jgi:predicted DNA-binding transcriptional regulator AlpA